MICAVRIVFASLRRSRQSAAARRSAMVTEGGLRSGSEIRVRASGRRARPRAAAGANACYKKYFFTYSLWR